MPDRFKKDSDVQVDAIIDLFSTLEFDQQKAIYAELTRYMVKPRRRRKE